MLLIFNGIYRVELGVENSGKPVQKISEKLE
jgi:hypothetical protein